MTKIKGKMKEILKIALLILFLVSGFFSFYALMSIQIYSDKLLRLEDFALYTAIPYIP